MSVFCSLQATRQNDQLTLAGQIFKACRLNKHKPVASPNIACMIHSNLTLLLMFSVDDIQAELK